MIQQGTYLQVRDNSGAKEVCCLKIVSGYKRRYGKVGDILVVSIKKLRTKRRSQSKVQKGTLSRALILSTRQRQNKVDGSQFSFLENGVALLNKQGRPLGSRILGPVPKSLRYSKYMRIASLSGGLIK
jgi:large subunit ribosomal protein L14